MTESESATPTLVEDGERMVPEFHTGLLIYAEHLTRYRSALPVVAGRVVLDIASGSGYGSQILATVAEHVYGVEIDAEAVAYSKAHFGAPNLEFLQGDAVAIPLPDDSVDVVVTFETIEHIEDQRAFMSEIKRVLRPDGIALISTPNDLEFAEGNHYHLHEFEYEELLALVATEFAFCDPYFQATWKYVAVGTEATFATQGSMPTPTENLAPLSRDQFLYFYLACANVPIERHIQPTAAVGSHYSERAQATHDATVQGQLAHLQRLLDERSGREEDLERERDQARGERDAARRELQVLLSTRVVRYSRYPRRAYRELRRIIGDLREQRAGTRT
ncbi:MAG: hypothetical protein QOG80_2744 [Pseudonocardiales bacterium]|jgi:SAM-dependent methyltransferase|nr:hypothetical protein [Pseudonocardiales bacterium]